MEIPLPKNGNLFQPMKTHMSPYLKSSREKRRLHLHPFPHLALILHKYCTNLVSISHQSRINLARKSCTPLAHPSGDLRECTKCVYNVEWVNTVPIGSPADSTMRTRSQNRRIAISNHLSSSWTSRQSRGLSRRCTSERARSKMAASSSAGHAKSCEGCICGSLKR